MAVIPRLSTPNAHDVAYPASHRTRKDSVCLTLTASVGSQAVTTIEIRSAPGCQDEDHREGDGV